LTNTVAEVIAFEPFTFGGTLVFGTEFLATFGVVSTSLATFVLVFTKEFTVWARGWFSRAVSR